MKGRRGGGKEEMCLPSPIPTAAPREKGKKKRFLKGGKGGGEKKKNTLKTNTYNCSCASGGT